MRVTNVQAAVDRLVPSIFDVSVTNVRNADCDFCGFARSKALPGASRYIGPSAFERALAILYLRGMRCITLQGGEPLTHPEVVRLVSDTTRSGIQCALITNGWFLPRDIDALAKAGLKRLLVSVDSAAMAERERNRGLERLEQRLVEGIGLARRFAIPVSASVTVSRLVSYEELPATLRRLGFDPVSFSYPRREPLGSTSLVYDGQSALIDLSRNEFLAAPTRIECKRCVTPTLLGLRPRG